MKRFSLFLFLICAACGNDRQYEFYDTLYGANDAGLTLTQSNHAHGWKQSRCFMCHVKANIHQVDRIGSPVFDLAKELVEQQGIQSCSTCHGENGL